MEFTMTRWHADGLRWIASVLTAVAERLERPGPELAPLEPMPPVTPRDEALYDLRHRLNNTW